MVDYDTLWSFLSFLFFSIINAIEIWKLAMLHADFKFEGELLSLYHNQKNKQFKD